MHMHAADCAAIQRTRSLTHTPQVIKEIALTEPLVDVVEARAVLSAPATILDLNLSNVTRADLAFSSPFALHFVRDDAVHALVAYFDCAFGAMPAVVSFSTGPAAPYTHWKQTVFYLREPVRVARGDAARGTIAVRPNAGNERDLDISIVVNFELSTEGGGEPQTLTVTQDYRLR
jgi:type I protein arginine methyltransferase